MHYWMPKQLVRVFTLFLWSNLPIFITQPGHIVNFLKTHLIFNCDVAANYLNKSNKHVLVPQKTRHCNMKCVTRYKITGKNHGWRDFRVFTRFYGIIDLFL